MPAAVAAVAAVAAALIAGCGGGDAGAGTVPDRTAPAPAASQPAVTAPQPGVATRKPDQIVDIRPPQEARPSLFLVGDSLGVGMARDLQADLPGWTVSVDVHNGLVAGLGMPLWRAQQTPYTVSAFSLFTNDDPANLVGLEQIVRESVERVFSRCAIWAHDPRPAAQRGDLRRRERAAAPAGRRIPRPPVVRRALGGDGHRAPRARSRRLRPRDRRGLRAAGAAVRRGRAQVVRQAA